MLKIIHVGLGGWGRDWAKNVLKGNKEVEVVAAVDFEPTILELAREQLDLPAALFYSSFDEALAATDADAALITANLPGHVALATQALSAGKHVLMEKPFAPSVAEAEQVVKLAKEHNRTLMISQNYRFSPAVQAVRELLRAGSMGAVGAVAVDFRRYANTAAKEGNRHYTLTQPLLSDMSIHHFDLMRAVLNQEPVIVDCFAWNPPWSNFVDPAAAFATITFDGGAVVSYRGSWVSPGPATLWAGEWRIECEKGEIVWTSRDDKSAASADAVSVKMLGEVPKSLKLPQVDYIDRAGSLHAFAQAIAAGKQPESSGQENLGSLGLMYATIAASKGEPVHLTSAAAQTQ